MKTENLSLLGKSTLPPNSTQTSFVFFASDGKPATAKGRAETACKKRKHGGFSLGGSVKGPRLPASRGGRQGRGDSRINNRSVDNYRNASQQRQLEDALLGTGEG